jgi:transglutaminase-like putative cysteine protease
MKFTQINMDQTNILHRKLKLILILLLGIFALFYGTFIGYSSNKTLPIETTNVLTEDIQKGIEEYIEKKSHEGRGYFQFSTGDKEFSFKLVRIHTEYLANLGPGSYFACVDLVDNVGDVYDVDFFLKGDPGSMDVIETTIHKLNGIPFYLWEQNKNGTWEKVYAKDASQKLLGVITGSDEFSFRYFATLPTIKSSARMWIPYPTTNSFQEVKVISLNAPGKQRLLVEKKHGNKVLFLELEPKDSGKNIDIHYKVKRLEKAAYTAKDVNLEKFMKVPAQGSFKEIAENVVEGKKGDLVRARALYDHVINNFSYIKYGDGWGKGDAVYACDSRTGNCTDFHAYFIALARSVGIPARFAIGAAIPSSRNDGGVDGYHCWAEFYAEGKWWPVDISEGNKYSSLSTYYFGHHPANRFEFSRGRDLVIEPGPKSGPINFLAYPVLEVDGKPRKSSVKLSFNRHKT